jgi:hypothetical protein
MGIHCTRADVYDCLHRCGAGVGSTQARPFSLERKVPQDRLPRRGHLDTCGRWRSRRAGSRIKWIVEQPRHHRRTLYFPAVYCLCSGGEIRRTQPVCSWTHHPQPLTFRLLPLQLLLLWRMARLALLHPVVLAGHWELQRCSGWIDASSQHLLWRQWIPSRWLLHETDCKVLLDYRDYVHESYHRPCADPNIRWDGQGEHAHDGSGDVHMFLFKRMRGDHYTYWIE